MLIASLFIFTKGTTQFEIEHYYKVNFPTDADYRSCSYDIKGYPYVYFTDPNGDVRPTDNQDIQ
jgi:hypothetical protein